jgi:hypothetical protein
MSNARPSHIHNLCQFTFANGRKCRLPAHPKGEGLCLTHFRYTKAQAKPQPREDDLSAEITSLAGDYITKIDINHVLGKLFDALAANRLSARRAASLAYIAALLLQSQEGAWNEARRWHLEMPVFTNLLRLKYPKNHPNHPRPDEKPVRAQSRATSRPPDPAPKPATQAVNKSLQQPIPKSPHDPAAESARPATLKPLLDPSTDHLPIV